MTTETRTIQILDPRLEEVPEEVGVSAVLPVWKARWWVCWKTANTMPTHS